MRILQSWLRKYIRFHLEPEQLAERLGMLGLEVEGIEKLGERYTGFVVGEVLSVSKHPNADKLSVCSVDVATETLQIVCGAPNVAPTQKVVVGRIGAIVPKNQHDPHGNPFVLSSVRIRGVESVGMICSEYELDLGKDSDGIMVLDPAAKPGQPLADYFGLNDVAFDLEVTANRPDWLSHYGVAREAGVLVGKPASLPAVRVKESKNPIAKYLKVTVVEKKDCYRFSARMIKGVKIAPSPQWLQNALRNVGLRPRNNVVDVTNYVMLECGQPLHAFDYALLRQKKIVVRQAEAGREFVTLDGKSHELPSGTVMVCDGEREISIAGIMGGSNSEINDNTVDVVLESACWNPSSIRRTRHALGINTDASQRFERGTDPNGVLYALQRATQLIHELAGGEVLKGVIDLISRPIHSKEIVLRTDRVNGTLGTQFTSGQISNFLKPLGVKILSKNLTALKGRIPTYRVDLEREIDLIEEVARVYGYDKIEEKSTASVDFSHPFERSLFTDEVRSIAIAHGFQESLSYSMQDLETAEIAKRIPVRLKNPQTSENAAMRTSLVPGLLSSVARNMSFGNADLRLFEVGKVYRVESNPALNIVDDFMEEEVVCLLLTGVKAPRYWDRQVEALDLFDMKGEVADFVEKFALDKSRFISYSTSNRLADSVIAVEINGSYAGYFGKVKEDILNRYDIKQDVFVAEIDLHGLRSVGLAKHYVSLPKYPRVHRDVAFTVDDSTPAMTIEEIIRKASSPLVQSVELFDVYQGESLPAGKKSIAFTLDLVSWERTLTDPEIEVEVKRIVDAVVTQTGGALRAL
jgi:phenylalanyl-tRNA synthetase beta chain